MSEEPQLIETEPTSDERLFAALAYVFSPIVPILLLFSEELKQRPFIRAHNIQALIAGAVLGIIMFFLVPFTLGCGAIAWVIMLYWAYKAYQGNYINIPVLTDFVKNQGWA
jgi:uncharacterized membrane protein